MESTERKQVKSKEIRDLLDSMRGVDKIGWSGKYQVFIFKRFYFYGTIASRGMRSATFAELMKNQLEELGYIFEVTSNENHWNAWPKDSWFEARGKIYKK